LAPIGFIESESTVIIESAQVIGLRLITSKISAKKITPLFTTSYGLGELIRYALDFKPRRIVVGLGGTATVDGGIGALSALGVKFLDRRGRPVELNGRGLGRIARVDLEGLDPRLHKVEIICACDVENPLLGPKGAARVYGPQKGANQKEVQSLEAGLRRFAQVAKRWTGKAIGRICYGGAAGGIPAGFYAFLDARLINGAEFCLERSKFNEQVKGVRLAITGEGRIDRQTVYGKLPIILARKLAGIPLIIIAGAVEDRKILSDSGIDFLFSIAPGPITLEESKSRASRLIQETVEAVVWLVKTFNGRKSS
jgi:glycerate kinase